MVIMAMHWGIEYSMEPSEEQRELARRMAEAGANIIIGNHPHVIQPMTYIGNTLVVYSLGNFVSNQSGYNKQTGLMASANIVKRTYHGKTTVTIEDATAELIYTNRNDKYIVYPYSKLNNNILSGYKSYYDKLKNIMLSMSKEIIVKEL